MNDTQRISAIASVLLVFASAVFGWMAWRRGALPFKPPELEAPALIPPGDQDIVARLWEDPLRAVQATMSSHDADPHHSATSLARRIERQLSDSERQLLLMVLPVPGTPFPDDAETRLRMRYALQLAMAHHRYSPSDRDHLGYLPLPWFGPTGPHPHGSDGTPRLAEYSAAVESRLPVAFEWFAPPADSKGPDVLVLWMPESALGNAPLCNLAYLQSTLVGKATNQLAGLYLLGPRASDTLKVFAATREFPAAPEGKSHVCADHLRTVFRIYTSQATAPDPLIGIEASERRDRVRAGLEKLLQGMLGAGTGDSTSRRYVANFIATDDQLTDLLAWELRQRGIDPERDKILLLCEADTSYGRALPLALRASLLATNRYPMDFPTPQRLADGPGSLPERTNIVILYYLRGLDKSKGVRQDAAARSSPVSLKPAEQTLAELLQAPSAPPVGESQLDYVERLPLELERDSARAVGVLGSDVEDKLILLRALRRRLPDSVFFTTDLDARLWHPHHLPYTHNLVVASGHDVYEHTDRPFHMPGFRDSYQTAMFRACVTALSDAMGRSSPADTTTPAPRLFELGRNGPVALEWRDRQNLRIQALGVYLQRLLEPGVLWPAFLIVLSLCGATVIWAFTRTECGESSPLDWVLALSLRRRIWALVSVAVVGAFVLLGAIDGARAGGEPWVWFQGISSWPTHTLQLLTIVLVLWLTCPLLKRHFHHRENLRRKYAGDTTVEPAPCSRPRAAIPRAHASLPMAWQSLRDAWKLVIRQWPTAAGGQVDVASVVDEWQSKSAPGPRLIRIACVSVLYLMLTVGIIWLLGWPASANVRGTIARVADAILFGASMVAFSFLLFYVLDSVWLSSRLLFQIGAPVSRWPKPAVEMARRRLGSAGDLPSESDVEGWLDVQFAAEKTEFTGRLIFLPFIVLLLMLAARNRVFDAWSWPPALVLVCFLNVALAAFCWAILRRAASRVREHARGKLQRRLHDISLALIDADATARPTRLREQFLLQALLGDIDRESRGAYAKLIQDPAVVAMLIPSGVLGILTVAFYMLFGQV